MNLEDAKELIKEEFMNNVMSNLDSALIFTYVKSLEDRISKAIEYIINKSVLSIKGLDLNICDSEIEDLLNILQGSDKE